MVLSARSPSAGTVSTYSTESFAEANLPVQSNLLAKDARGRLHVATDEGHIIRTDGRRTTSGALSGRPSGSLEDLLFDRTGYLRVLFKEASHQLDRNSTCIF
jgi:ligand-binding sensor domain-containing protein